MVKEGIEDWQRQQQDHEVNNRKVKVHRGHGVFEISQWKKLKVGDIVKVEKDEFFPADLLLLSSSYDDAICYVETMNLDGETNLKLKQSLDLTSSINFKATVRCEDPNASLYTFVGTMQFQEQRGIIVFFLCIKALNPESYNKNGKTAGMEIVGATMYACVVWVVNCQMALAVSYLTLIQHILIWGGVVLWYLFLLSYGSLPASISTTAYKVFTETLAPAPSFWLVTLFVVIGSLIPYFSLKAIQMRFFPGYHGMVQWIRHEGQTDDHEYCNMVRQRSIRTTTVGLTARSVARDNNLYNLDRHLER